MLKVPSKRKVAVMGLVLIVGAGVAVGILFGLAAMDMFNRNPYFVCHRGLDGAVEQWMQENKSDAYPNVDGSGDKSCKLIDAYFSVGNEDALRDYGYIAGLRPGDPGELVQFYLKKKTRRKWHGDRFALTGERYWVIISLSRDGKGELSDWVTTQEFSRKMDTTLRFLETHQRPGWSNAVAEHRAFLQKVAE